MSSGRGSPPEFPGPSNTGWVPADDNLAAGPTEIIVAVNEELAFFNRDGSARSPGSIDLATLFPNAAAVSVFDPRIAYDPANGGHFLLTGLEQNNAPQASFLDIAVSVGNTPGASASDWRTFRVNTLKTISGVPYWLDFDGLGFDSTALYVTGNLFDFPGNLNTAEVFTFDKNALETSSQVGGPTTLLPTNSEVLPSSSSVTPAVTTGTPAAEYMMEDYDATHVRVWAVTGALGANFAVTNALLTVPSYGLNLPGARQAGTSNLIDTGDTRVLNAVYQDGALWAAQTIENTNPSDDKALARWYQVNPNTWPASSSPTLTRSTTIDPGPGIATFYPSIGVDALGNAVVGYAESSPSMFVSAFYTTYPASGAGVTGTIQVGQASYAGSRWGDYSGTVADPTVLGQFWTVGMSTLANGNWGTWWTPVTIASQVTASQLSFTTAPATATAGTTFSVTVTAKDAQGHTATGYAGTVHFTSSDVQAGLPANYTFTAADNGAHTFNITLKTGGNQTLTAGDITNSITAAQATVAVSPAAASLLRLRNVPASAVAGQATGFVVLAQDPFGNTATGFTGTVHFTSTDPQAVLPANATFTAADAGQKSLSFTLKTAGNQSITASVVSGAVTSAQASVNVVPAATSALVFSGLPATLVAGQAGGFMVIAEDAFGNVTPGYTGTVHFTSTDPLAVLPPDRAFNAADAGKHSFSVTFGRTGTQALTAGDVAGVIVAAQGTVSVTPAAVSAFSVTGFPGSVTAGQAGSVTITALDSFGNTATGYTGTVVFGSSDSQATLPANYAFTAADAGKHTFSSGVILRTAGSQTIRVNDASVSSATGQESGISVSPASPALLVFGQQPANTTAGVPIAPAVTVLVEDAFHNLETNDNTDVVTLSLQGGTPAGGAFAPESTNQATSSSGVASFNHLLVNQLASGYTLAASSGSLQGATSASFSVNAAAAASFTISAPAGPLTAGQAASFTVTAHDSFGNTAGGYVGTIHFASSDPQAGLPSDYTFTPSDAGEHTFSITLKTAGSQNVRVTDASTPSITGLQSNISVTPAAASTVAFTGFPAPIAAGVAGGFTATMFDAFGNVATGYTGTLHFTSSDAQASLPADYPFVAADQGAHSFSVTLRTAGSQSIHAQDAAAPAVAGTLNGLSVTPAGASTLDVTGFPLNTTAGSSGNVTITARDAFGNVATGFAGTVHFTSTDPQAALTADYTFVLADNGAHSFPATLKTAGSQTIHVQVPGGSVAGTSAAITVNPGAPSALAFSVPASFKAGVPFSVTVKALDPFGNVAPSYAGTVAITSTDTRATLPANYTFIPADNGSHSFTLTLWRPATQTVTDTGGQATAGHFSVSAITPPPDKPPGDYDGSGPTDLAVLRPTTYQWLIMRPTLGGLTKQFGTTGDIPVTGDYDGDGISDFAVYRPSTQQWFIVRSSAGPEVVSFGQPGQVPVPADYDGDGKTDLALYDPTTATWSIQQSTGGTVTRQFGQPGVDLPVPADYDGDGKADIAVYRPTTATWYVMQSTAGPRSQAFGAPGLDQPVPADYNGDGKADFAVFRPTAGQYFVMPSGGAPFSVALGAPGDIPVPGDYDYDGKVDFAVFHPATAVWTIQQSSAGMRTQQFGAPGLDYPLTAPLSYRFGNALGVNAFHKSAGGGSAPAFKASNDALLVVIPSRTRRTDVHDEAINQLT